ncbi:MAG: helix-turn-helix domain-containing protein [Candidatus Thorarchaeota archaeon]
MKTVNLEAYGFDSSCNKVYNYLLSNALKLSAKNISETLNIASKAVYAALKQLEKNNLIETFEDEYPKLFAIQNPAHTLSQLAESQIDKRNEEIRSIRAELDKAQTTYLNQFIKGSCKRQISFYYFHNSVLASAFLFEHLSGAQSEVLINLIPKRILLQYIDVLNQLASTNIWVGIYLHKTDLEIVPDLEANIKAYTVDSSTQHYVSVDNQIYNSGNILLDRKRFISIDYDPQGSEWILSSFLDHSVVENMKNQIRKRAFEDARELLKEQRANKSISKRIVDLLSENGDLSKQELVELLQVSGKNLNSSLTRLEETNQIRVKRISKGRGRPQERVVLVE